MISWPVKRMSDLCEITSSKRIFASDYVSEGVPFYRGREITEKYNGNLDISTELFITEEKFREIASKFGAPETGDLLLTSVGTLGSVYVVKSSDRFYFKDGNLTWFRHFTGLDSRFLYYWMGSPKGKAELKKCTIGSSQPAFTIVLLKGMEIELPPLVTQKRIADILSSYDNLIEINQRRIKILEEMAQAIYREWFVNFRFPGHENHKFEETLDGKMPEGWRRMPVSSLVTRYASGTIYKDADVNEYGRIPVVDQSTAELLGFHDNQPDIFASEIKPVAIFGDHTCKMQLLLEPFSIGPNIVPFVSNPSVDLPIIYLFYAVNGLVNTQEYKRHWTSLNAKEVLVSDKSIANEFSRLILPNLLSVYNLRAINRNLSKTRDLLLPRLLSGQINLEAA